MADDVLPCFTCGVYHTGMPCMTNPVPCPCNLCQQVTVATNYIQNRYGSGSGGAGGGGAGGSGTYNVVPPSSSGVSGTSSPGGGGLASWVSGGNASYASGGVIPPGSNYSYYTSSSSSSFNPVYPMRRTPARGLPGFDPSTSQRKWDETDFAVGTVLGARWWNWNVPNFIRLNPAQPDLEWPGGRLTGQAAQAWPDGKWEATCNQMAEHNPAVPVEECGCVSPETRVLTADLRWVPAGDLTEGEHLFAFDEYPASHGYQDASGRKYRDAVVASTERGKLPCYDLTFEDGTQVRVSADHQWLCYAGQKAANWVRTDELRAGDIRASHVVKPFEPWNTDESRGAGYLAAAYDGEGSLFQSDVSEDRYQFRLDFTQADNPMLHEVERELKERDYRYAHQVAPRGYNKLLRVDGSPRLDMHRFTITNRPDMMRFLGSVRPVRLLPKLQPGNLGRLNMLSRVRLVGKTYVGEREVVKLGTTAGTYFAEGLASHNCGVWAYWTMQRAPTRLVYYAMGDQFTIPVCGIAEGSGRVLLGGKGFRSQYAKIVALHIPAPSVESFWQASYPYQNSYGYGAHAAQIPPNDSDDMKRLESLRDAWMAAFEARLEELYPSARIFSTMPAMLATFPPEAPPEPTAES